jgi:alkylation response protein AidB-like acyl-CoA dehydrogenase
MDFTTPPRVAELLPSLRAFVQNHLFPLEQSCLAKGWSAVAPEMERVREEVRRRGWWAPHLSHEHGGMGLSLMEFAFLSEELGRTPLGHFAFNCQAPDVGNMEILAEFGTAEQKRAWLEPLAAGRIRSCFSMTEPDRPGSNPAWMATTARRDGGQWVIDGRKWFTTAAEGAAFAIVMAVTDPDAPNVYARASQIIVPSGTPGFRIVRNLPVMGEAGAEWASHAEVVYENVRVPLSNLLGEEGAGFVIAQARLGPGRIHHCMRWIGICQRAFDLMCTRAATRELSPGKPLGLKGTVQAWIADSRAEIDSARLLVLHAAWRIDRDGSYVARDEISLIKIVVARILQRVLDRAIQTHGALGLTDDLPLAWWYRHERGARIYDGPDEVHQASVARHILAGYGLARRRGEGA